MQRQEGGQGLCAGVLFLSAEPKDLQQFQPKLQSPAWEPEHRESQEGYGAHGDFYCVCEDGFHEKSIDVKVLSVIAKFTGRGEMILE